MGLGRYSMKSHLSWCALNFRWLYMKVSVSGDLNFYQFHRKSWEIWLAQCTKLTAIARSSISSLEMTPSPSRSYKWNVHSNFSSLLPLTRIERPRTKSLESLTITNFVKFDLKYLKGNYFSVLLCYCREDVVRVRAHIRCKHSSSTLTVNWQARRLELRATAAYHPPLGHI